MIVDPLLHPLIAEIFEQDQAFFGPCPENLRSAHTVFIQPARHMQEGTSIFLGRWSVHQHGAAIPHAKPEIPAERGVADERDDLRPVPSRIAEKTVETFG